MKDQLEENKKRQQNSTTNSTTATTTTSATTTTTTSNKPTYILPNLKEIERNNKLRTVEAHLYATIVNQPLPVKPSVSTSTVTPERSAEQTAVRGLTAALAASGVVSPAPVAMKRGTDSAPHSRSGSFSYSAKSMKPHTQVVLAHTPVAAAGTTTTGTGSKGGEVNKNKDTTGHSSIKNKTTAVPTTTAVTVPPASGAASTITTAVESHMAGICAVTAPVNLPLFQKNLENNAKHRTAVTAEIRRRMLERRRGWEMLGDAYLEVGHKWTAHVEQVEKDEGGYKEGPKLRGSASTGHMGTSFSLGGISTSTGLAGLSGALAGFAGPGSAADLQGLVGRTQELSAAVSTRTGLGVARSDYEQVLFLSFIILLFLY